VRDYSIFKEYRFFGSSNKNCGHHNIWNVTSHRHRMEDTKTSDQLTQRHATESSTFWRHRDRGHLSDTAIAEDAII